MNYKKNASSNRDALFGGEPAAAGNKPKKASSSSSSSRPRTTTTGSSTAASGTAAPSQQQQQQSQPSSRGYNRDRSKPGTAASLLSPDARAAKLKEASEHAAKAAAAMQPGLFKRPDPLAASTYYKRAAECYKAVGDANQERHYRAASARCNQQIGAWASAAQDYTRAAELIVPPGAIHNSDLIDQDCRDASEYHKQAAESWRQADDKAKAASSLVASALALNANSRGSLLSKSSLAGLEEAVEAHVPDVLNPFARYRQTGHSAFIDPDSDETVEHPSKDTLSAAREHLVSRSYAHEPLLRLVELLASSGEYASALYAAGAASTILSQDGISTLTLGRSFVVETILQLALGDPVGAEQTFLSRHCESRPYLSSREAQLAEELTRAIKNRDGDALEEARSPTGPNRAGLANLSPPLRELVGQLRVSVRGCESLETEFVVANKSRASAFHSLSNGCFFAGRRSKAGGSHRSTCRRRFFGLSTRIGGGRQGSSGSVPPGASEQEDGLRGGRCSRGRCGGAERRRAGRGAGRVGLWGRRR